jgi:hypothetical protein
MDVKSQASTKPKQKGNPQMNGTTKKLVCFCWLLHTQDEQHYINEDE